MLLTRGADGNNAESDGRTTVYFASKSRDREIVRYLKAPGANGIATTSILGP